MVCTVAYAVADAASADWEKRSQGRAATALLRLLSFTMLPQSLVNKIRNCIGWVSLTVIPRTGYPFTPSVLRFSFHAKKGVGLCYQTLSK